MTSVLTLTPFKGVLFLSLLPALLPLLLFSPLASPADLCSCFLVSSPSHFCSRCAVGSPDTSQHLLLVPSPQLGRGMESSSGRSLFVPVLSCHADIADLQPNFASGSSLSPLCCDMSVIRCSQLLW